MITVLVIDDQPAVRQGLRMQLGLEPDLAVIGEAGDGRDALTLAERLKPDVVIMDVEMPHMDGISATRSLQELEAAPAVVILSIHDDMHTRKQAANAGAVAFVEKRSPELLLQAVRQAAHSSEPD